MRLATGFETFKVQNRYSIMNEPVIECIGNIEPIEFFFCLRLYFFFNCIHILQNYYGQYVFRNEFRYKFYQRCASIRYRYTKHYYIAVKFVDEI